MREALRDSLRRSTLDAWPKDTVFVCTSCLVPLYVLTARVPLVNPSTLARDGQIGTPLLASYFRPLDPADLERYPEPVRVWANGRTRLEWFEHCAGIPQPRNGDRLICPVCHQAWAQYRAVSEGEVIDTGGVVELVGVLPDGRFAGKLPQTQDSAWRH
jgi:hypothetical protein